ncbi:hypothetical protein [Komagataeibacter rhaeticus]|uniref:hypothetical protein n=1 Tax=Komagataeibacter rhaeticus TaxID=215221 RepID=UPI001300C951|nr:hypothetical protein [Komagataeibacter rhaeticus]QOC47195.1 hypothetical protein ICJ78_03470 [Komagataeibacter rhaeticus]
MAFSGSASETRCVAGHRLDRAATRRRGEPGLIARSWSGTGLTGTPAPMARATWPVHSVSPFLATMWGRPRHHLCARNTALRPTAWLEPRCKSAPAAPKAATARMDNIPRAGAAPAYTHHGPPSSARGHGGNRIPPVTLPDHGRRHHA